MRIKTEPAVTYSLLLTEHEACCLQSALWCFFKDMIAKENNDREGVIKTWSTTFDNFNKLSEVLDREGL
jgi:hypothetical protein